MNTTNAIFQRLGQNYLSDNKEALGIQKINSWALSRLYNNTIKQRQTQKDKTLYTYLQWKNIQSIQNSTALRKKKQNRTDKDKCFSLRGSGSAVIRQESRGLVQVEMTTQ